MKEDVSPRIESICVRNFRVLRDVNLTNLPPFAVFVGENGTGKSTVFQVFGFLKNALESNVDIALQRLGGYREVAGRGHTDEPIVIKIQFRMRISDKDRLVTYNLEIDRGKGDKPVVLREYLSYKRMKYGSPFRFLDFKKGRGFAIENEDDFSKQDTDLLRVEEKLESPNILAIKGLGQFERFKAASTFRKLIENWHVSDFHISDARQHPDAAADEHLSPTGGNLPLVVQHLYHNEPDVLKNIIKKFQKRIPGMRDVIPHQTEDGRVLLRFQDVNFDIPFIARYVSDGTIKMFAYMVLLNDPKPHSFLCVDEPENQLDPDLMWVLAEELRDYARRGGQVFVSTHSPDFLNFVEPEETYFMKKKHGESEIHPLSQNKQVVSLIEGGDQLGYLWGQGVFNPEMKYGNQS